MSATDVKLIPKISIGSDDDDIQFPDIAGSSPPRVEEGRGRTGRVNSGGSVTEEDGEVECEGEKEDDISALSVPVIDVIKINCTRIGEVTVHIQGIRALNEVVIMTVQDLGCDFDLYRQFVNLNRMSAVRDRTVWLHVSCPGQGADEPDLPSDYQYPRLSLIGEDLVCILDTLGIQQVVCFGEGAGANVLARFAMAHIHRVLGVCLIHATGTTASLVESLKQKLMLWKLDEGEMNKSAEKYLILHRLGGLSTKSADEDEWRQAVDAYKDVLRNKINTRNLKKFVETFLKRSNIEDKIENLKCPILLVTGQLSVFNDATRSLHKAILKTCQDKSKVDFIEVPQVANVLEEKPDKLAECFQYFIQGLGLVSSAPMYSVVVSKSLPRNRRMSMEDYDKPSRDRKMSCGIFPPANPTLIRERRSSCVTITPRIRRLSVGTPPKLAVPMPRRQVSCSDKMCDIVVE